VYTRESNKSGGLGGFLTGSAFAKGTAWQDFA
jgi:hypothetical protein